jgi:peptide/nickel transport system substrate-binding protein
MSKLKNGRLLAIILLLAIVLVACQPQEVVREVEVPVEVTRVVTETVVEGGEEVEVTRVITEEVIQVVTATPEPVEEVTFDAPNPETYTSLTFGDIDTMDPALAYDTASGQLLENVMEGLVTFNGTDPNTFVPALAEEVPSVENGLVSEDGMTYTFNIREGVTFHEGGTLEPHDVAYSFQRGLLQSDPNGPQWLLLEPIMGYNHAYDITENIAEGAYAGDKEGLLANATPEELVAVCEEVQSRIVADDEAGTVTFTLAMPWGPFIATIGQYWGSVLDSEWAIENGAWDGDCATWQNWYAPGAENAELGAIVNGTGPYMLDHWTPGEEYVLVKNPNYWRTDEMPIWEGGPAGQAEIDTVIVRIVNEWSTRFAALQAGDAESAAVNPADRPQADEFVGEFCDYETNTCTPNEEKPNGPLRKWGNLLSLSRTDIFMVFNIAVDENGENPYIGSGQLDGNGIPPDFFSDIHVRRAFNYCFDYDTYIAEALNGEGVRNNGPIILDMLGYNPEGEMFEYDPEQCAAEMEQAWGGQVAQVGFRFQIAYNQGNTARQTVAEILSAEFSAINELYQIETIGLPWPTFLRSQRASLLPIFVSGWAEDIHDPHNWVQPFLIGTYAGRQGLPQEMLDRYGELINQGVATTDPAEREEIYFEIQRQHHEDAIQVTLAQALGARYEQRWVQGWYYQPSSSGTYFAALSLAGGE